MSAPEEHECLLESASALAIDAIYSEEFEAELGSFASFAARSDTYGKQWQSFDVSKVAEMLRSKVRAVTVSTYGGVPGWWVYVFSGNLAYDGATDGPIRLNRWGLPRSRASVANSIAHEVAHRAALEHPHSDTNLSIAECEPPYVIGTLVEKHASRGDWKLGKGDCVDLNVLDRESAHPPIKKAESAGEEAAPMPSAVEN